MENQNWGKWRGKWCALYREGGGVRGAHTKSQNTCPKFLSSRAPSVWTNAWESPPWCFAESLRPRIPSPFPSRWACNQNRTPQKMSVGPTRFRIFFKNTSGQFSNFPMWYRGFWKIQKGSCRIRSGIWAHPLFPTCNVSKSCSPCQHYQLKQ